LFYSPGTLGNSWPSNEAKKHLVAMATML